MWAFVREECCGARISRRKSSPTRKKEKEEEGKGANDPVESSWENRGGKVKLWRGGGGAFAFDVWHLESTLVGGSHLHRNQTVLQGSCPSLAADIYTL